MKKSKERVVWPVEQATGLPAIVKEALLLGAEHRKRFHGTVDSSKPDMCIICRSLRRTIVRGVPK